MKLPSNLAQAVVSNPLALAVSIKETNPSLRLLKGLNQSVQKNPIKTTVAKFDAILMVFAEGLHRWLLGGQIPGTYRDECLCDIEWHNGISRAKPLNS